MALVIEHLHKFFELGIYIDSAHVHTGSHDFAHGGLDKIEDVQNHLAFFFLKPFALARLQIGQVGLDCVTALFGQKTQLGIVAEQLEQLHEKPVAEHRRRGKRNPDNPEQRNQHDSNRIGLEAPEQVSAEHREHVDAGTSDNQVGRTAQRPIILDPRIRQRLEQVVAQ